MKKLSSSGKGGPGLDFKYTTEIIKKKSHQAPVKLTAIESFDNESPSILNNIATVHNNAKIPPEYP